MKLPRHLLLLFTLALPLFSCSCEGIQPPPSRPLYPPPEEVSAKPGINEDFLAEEVDLAKWVATFESESREIAAQKQAIVASMNLKKGQEVADVGSVEVHERLARHLRLLAGASHVVAAHRGEQVEVRLSKERSVELPPLSVDVAFVCDTYHHFEYPQHVLFSLFKAVRPLGSLIVVDFERVPGTSRQWVLDHVRADKRTFIKEIEQAGFVFEEEMKVPGMQENYVLRFRRP